MRRALLILNCVALALFACAAGPEYLREVERWQEASVPSETNKPSYMSWEYAGNRSKRHWCVFAERGQVCVQLTTAKPPEQGERPRFTPKAGWFRGASAFARVDDGWLVGFNQGEWDGALYWFSSDGKRSYKISDHQVVDFFSLEDGLHAIEGLSHLSTSEGSIIHIARPKPGAHWQASTVTKLPSAPHAICVRRDGTLLVTLSGSLVSVGADRKVTTLLSDPRWGSLYPNSSVLSSNEQKLYIGMRQFVGEFDMLTKKLRLLIPSEAFLNKLSEEDEQRIRKQYSE